MPAGKVAARRPEIDQVYVVDHVDERSATTLDWSYRFGPDWLCKKFDQEPIVRPLLLRVEQIWLVALLSSCQAAHKAVRKMMHNFPKPRGTFPQRDLHDSWLFYLSDQQPN